MSGPNRPPPPILKHPKPAEDGTTLAMFQMQMMCRWLMKELLEQSDEDIDSTIASYGDNWRELYDSVIDAINENPGIMKAKHKQSMINNIFDDYAGIAPEQRAFQAPAGIKVFKHVGHTTHDGAFAPIPSLTPGTKAKATPAKSPVRMVPFPPTDPSAKPMGYTSPTSPGGREAELEWPMKQGFLDHAEGNRIAMDRAGDRKLNQSCKIPTSLRQEVRDVRIGDGSVRDPSKNRSISCLLYTSPSPRDRQKSRMPSSA